MSIKPLPENIAGGWTGGKIRCALFVTPREKKHFEKDEILF